MIERHITLDKQWKGSDHKCSLEPTEFRQMVDDIRTVEEALGTPNKRFLPCEQTCHLKLGKSLVAARELCNGTLLTEELVTVKVSEPPGISCRHLTKVLGHKLNVTIKKDFPIQFSDLKDYGLSN